VARGLLPAARAPDAGCFTEALNTARKGSGLPTLAVDGDLAGIARAQARAMETAGRIFHNTALSDEAPAGWQTVGENVGMGPSCGAVARALMKSPEHRDNILDATYTEVGVGVALAPDGIVYVTEDFMGPRRGAEAAAGRGPSERGSGGSAAAPRSR